MFADRSTGAVVGASGIGASMDEIISQITLAIEIGWPVSRLQHVVQPFPTISELVGLAYERLATELEGPSATVAVREADQRSNFGEVGERREADSGRSATLSCAESRT